MGILDDNYSNAIEEHIEYMNDILNQADRAVCQVRRKYTEYRDNPKQSYKSGGYKKYTIVIKYERDNKQLARAFIAEVTSYTTWWVEVERLQKIVKGMIEKGDKVTKIYTK